LEIVLRLLRGESGELLSRELGLPIYKLERCDSDIIEGTLQQRALRFRPLGGWSPALDTMDRAVLDVSTSHRGAQER
jgi:hypothetical protein